MMLNDQKSMPTWKLALLEAGKGITSTPVEIPLLPLLVPVERVLLPKLDDSGS